MENTNTNIPVLHISAVVEQLIMLYSNAIKFGTELKNIPTPFFWGPAGVGKSEGVYQLAHGIEKSTGKHVEVIDVRLLLFSPVDLRGIPVADSKKEFANWLRPQIFNLDASENTINLLFLDELSAAPQSVQAVAYQICLDRRIGEHKLPDNCIVIAAGNRTTDQSIAYKMPKALCNRLMHFQISTDFESWRLWAVQNGIDSRVIGYLSFDNSRLCTEPDSSDMAYATPRSWSFVSTLIKTADCELENLHHLISACIGTDTAIEFEIWCKSHMDFPPVEQILAGDCKLYPKTQDVLFALCSSIVAVVRDSAESVSVQELENVCIYARRFPPDFAFALFKDMHSIEKIRIKLMKCQALNSWLAKNKRYL